MSTVNSEIIMQGNNDAWFTANASVIYPANIQIFHIDGRYKFSDGINTLSALPFLGSQTLAQTLANDNKTNDIAITSNDGYTQLLIDSAGSDTTYDDGSGVTTTVLLEQAEASLRVEDSNNDVSTIVKAGDENAFIRYSDNASNFTANVETNEFGVNISAIGVVDTSYINVQEDLIEFNSTVQNTFYAPNNNFPLETPSKIAIFDASGNLKSGTNAESDLELTSNKQNSLAVDGTGTKYVTVDSVNAGLDLIVPKYSGQWFTFPCGITQNVNGLNGQLVAIAIPVGTSVTVDAIRFRCTTAVAGGNVRVAIYEDNNGYPGNLIEESGNIDCSTTGEKIYTLSANYTTTSQVIFVSYKTSSATIALLITSFPVMILPRPTLGVKGNTYRIAQAFGAMPNPFTAGAILTNDGFGVIIELKKV
ncbi:MAG: hypothetical protein KBE91_02640 [Bacteroidia bacterium]|nr:hypothetical protein [Bacteroidia bacterium]